MELGAFYHLDRFNTLEEGQIIDLIKFDDIKPRELQIHVDKLFPDGVTKHGDSYFLNGRVKAEVASPIIELVFEYIRRSFHLERLSRFQSFFGFNSLSDALKFNEKFPTKKSIKIWEIKSREFFKADMNLLTLTGTPLQLSHRAHCYWMGKLYRDEPFWEILMKPPIQVKKLVYSIN